MSSPYVIDLKTHKLMDPAEIFGKDATRVMEACANVFHDFIHEYDGCYRSPSRPTVKEVGETIDRSNGESIVAAYKAAQTAWQAANPEEFAKEQRSRKEWEMNRDKQFRIIYGRAKHHGIHLDWHGKGHTCCCGDQWTVYHNHKSIARICCM